MKREREKKPRLSRIARAGLYAAATVLLVPLVYLILGCPSLTPEMAFRREERADLLGPSTILAIEANPLRSQGNLILAETDLGCLLYTDSGDDNDQAIYYREKTGDATILSPVIDPREIDRGGHALPIAVFDDFPDAQIAQLDIHYWGNYSTSGRREHRSIEQSVRRTAPGYFLFTQPFSNEDQAICNISVYLSEGVLPGDQDMISIAVSFYNADGALIARRVLEC